VKMSKVEKKFVNTRRHAQGNIRVLKRLFNHLDLQNIKNALEIGCGAGMLSNYLTQDYDIKVVGTDVDPEQIEIANKYFKGNKNLSFSVESAADLPFENDRFDMVLIFKVLHHINDWPKVLNEIGRVLKPNGYFVFSDFAYSKLLKKSLQSIVKNYGLYTLDDIIKHLSKNNITVIHREKSFGILFTPHNMLFKKVST
jgi:ubiquinone/menaquinone biosynthesis C-methylase UbiE